ncbi:hypothetical protein CA262_08155 [Sphingobium sp. GW456-12-10-14-TSB1]|uniref:hypothetical protein n=1 Tax=Sphingobium sp. GW456-12-10-14-TSB1 TaxID=1987165 RepID=UPI000A36D0A4|nr:hypothetical protein [Sphingobium sp. GW456-12-10-14-TSB1]OUC54828.1 hypothetical protein CA262_08155 [Sphingobium sp. GW456-12-10-14-TSB1]
MPHITENGWTLRYTIGRELVSAVDTGDTVHLPGGLDDLIVLGGRSPRRINDPGCVIVRGSVTQSGGETEVRPGALGMVWISAAGGWSETTASEKSPAYNAESVRQQIERDRRRHSISKREERLIHALLKGSASERPAQNEPPHSEPGWGPMGEKS